MRPKVALVSFIDDEALQSMESASESIDPAPPEDADPEDIAYQSMDAFFNLLSKSCTNMERPELLAVQGHRGTARRGKNGLIDQSFRL